MNKHAVLCLVVLITSLLVRTQTVNAQVSQQDSVALVALYDSTNGQNWNRSQNWKGGPVSTWFGITISSGRVTTINLTVNNLIGTIPPEIGDLTNLKFLDLAGNQLSSSIPAEIGKLDSLTQLWLHFNQLSGPIPSEIGELTNLEELILWGNQLSGDVPSEIINLKNLKELLLNDNQLVGLPELSGLTALNTLDISANRFTFEDIEPNIGIVNFRYSPQDSVGTEQDVSVKLNSSLTFSVLVGGNNNQYRWFKFNAGQIPGASESSFTLDSADLSDASDYICVITNTVAPALTLFSRPIHVTVDISVAEQDSLALVALYNSTDGPNWTDSSNWLSGPVHTWFGVAVAGGRVIRLDLENNNLAGIIPAEIANLTNLTSLDLSENQLSGALPGEIGSLTSLANLLLFRNQFSGKIPIEIGNLTNLDTLSLSFNQLSGAIPTEVGNLSTLLSLILAENQLSGAIPTEIGNLKNLEFLDLGFNRLSGAIPAAIGNLKNLEVMSLSTNQLSGNIPPEIGSLTNSTVLWFDRNQFSGAVPMEIGNLSKLVFLSLVHNQLVDLPNLSGMASLNTLRISNNRFTFEDIEPNIGIADFFYSPQDSVGTEQNRSVVLDSALTVSVSVGGDNNQYQWSKGLAMIPGATDSSYTLSSVTLSDSGAYTCKITNTVATDLTLHSRSIHVSVDVPPAAVTAAASDITAMSASLNGTANPNNLSTTVKFEYGFTTGYGNEVEAVESPVSGTGVVAVSATLTDLLPNAMYHYRTVATNSAGTTNGADETFTTPLPAYPSTLSINTNVNFPARSKASDYQTADYRIVGLPGNLNQSVQTVLTGEQNKDWQVYWDNGTATDFQVLFDGSDNFKFTTGRAFWVVNKGPLNIATSAAAAQLNASQEIEIPLQAGWNLITNPFTIAVNWQSVQAANSTPTTLTDPIWSFNGSFAQSTSFEPNTGYYFFNTNNLTALKIPYVLYYPGPLLSPRNAPLSWAVEIALSSGEFSENSTSFGISSESSSGLDALDFRKPRALGAIPGVAFQRPNWDAEYSHFASDIRPEFEETETWAFEVFTEEQIATLTFSGVASLPLQHAMYLIHEASGEFVDLRADSLYRFSPTQNRTEFRVLVGEDNAVQEVLASVVPEEFQLGQNYPNPFNPTTKIPVALPIDSEIELKVFNILGREVATIFSGQIQAGRHLFEWNGRNSGGNRLSSGLYFYRLTAGTKAALAGKMILLK